MPWIQTIDPLKNIPLSALVAADLKANPDKDVVKYISIKCMYRAKNSFGALVINRAIIHYSLIPPPSGEQFFIYSNEAE